MGRERAEATCQVPDLQGPFLLPNSEANEVGGVGWGFAPLYEILLLPCGGLAPSWAWNSC